MRRDTEGKKSTQELEETVREKECELHRRYCQMGKSLLEMAEAEQRAINTLVDEIIEARSRLAQNRGQLECPGCTAYNDADSQYCKRCGIKLERYEKRKEPEYGPDRTERGAE